VVVEVVGFLMKERHDQCLLVVVVQFWVVTPLAQMRWVSQEVLVLILEIVHFPKMWQQLWYLLIASSDNL